MNERNDVDDRIDAWFTEQRAVRAPDPILAAVTRRTLAEPQRRRAGWWPRTGGAGRASVPLRLGLGAVAAAVIVASVAAIGLLRPDAGRVVGGPGPTSPAATPPAVVASPDRSATTSPSPSPSLGLDELRIAFVVDGGVYTTVCCFAPGETITPGTGTFTMTGAWSSDGTFSDVVTYAPDGTYKVARTMTMPSGRLYATADVRTLTNVQSMTTKGTWRLTGGTGPWAEAAASGTLAGVQGTMVSQFSNKPSNEIWTGTVTP